MVVDGLDEIVDLAVVEFDGLLGLLEGLLVLEGGSLVEEGKEGGADAPECLVDAGHVPLLQEGVVRGEQAGPQVFHVVIIKLTIIWANNHRSSSSLLLRSSVSLMVATV